MLKDSAFQNKWIAVFQLGFQVRKILETFVKQDPGLAENGRELGKNDEKPWEDHAKTKQTNNNNKTPQQQEQQKTSQKKKQTNKKQRVVSHSLYLSLLSLAIRVLYLGDHDHSHVISINRGA